MLAFIIGIPGDKSTYQFLAVILVSGLLGLYVIRQKRDEEIDRLVWLFPGDTVKVVHVSGRPLMKELVGKELVVEYFGQLSKEIWARAEGEKQQLCFKPNEVELVGRSEKLRELTEKSGKLKIIS